VNLRGIIAEPAKVYRVGKRLLGFSAVAALLAVAPATGAAPSAGGLASDNVTYVTTVPFETGAGLTGARLAGDYLYVAGVRSFSIYDVSDPVAPALESITPTGPKFPNEDVDTNGKILLISNQQLGGTLEIWSVEDKAAPVLLATMENIRDHTFTCVLRCRYAYGAGGSIVDLRDPAEPRLAGNWSIFGPQRGFDTTEVSPGRVLTATPEIQLLDGRRDPTRPVTVAQGANPDNRLIHSVRWPNGGRERFFLVQGETPFSQKCEADSGAFMTWDTRGYRKTHTFQMADEYRVVNGTITDGNPPANAAGCTTMWFQEHPDYRNGGLVAAAFFDHGTRFLKVDARGEISEKGFFLPLGGETIATYWVTDQIVYAVDVTRGIDILRFES
jgi:hypothetical protein